MSTQTDAARTRSAGLTFAIVVLFAVGVMRIISALYYFADSDRVSEASGGPFKHHLIYWGVWDLLIAALALTAAFSLRKGNELGFVLGYTFAGGLIIQSLLLIAASPWYGFAGLEISFLILHALSTNDTSGIAYR